MLSVLFVALFCSACRQQANQVPNWRSLEAKYTAKEDLLKLNSVQFLKQRMDSLYSEQLIFHNPRTGEKVDVRLDTMTNEESLKNVMAKRNLQYSRRKVFDNEVLTTSQIDHFITEAYSIKERYSWSRNVPDSLFLNYVLPYKVAAEFPREWRSFFSQLYAEKLDSLDKAGVDNAQDVTRFLVKELESWYRFDAKNYLTSTFPDLYELLYSSKGECYRIAYLYTYALRAAGIPCVVDVVPIWGSKNAGHAEYVSLDSTGKLSSNVATAHKNVLERAAKVFRLTFEDSDSYTKNIVPFIGDYPFLIDYLKHDHIIDVTDEHTQAVDLTYPLSQEDGDTPFAYICVLNYNRWMPVFWGRNINGKVLFKKMNTNILYQVGIPNGKQIKMAGEVFFIDSLGKMHTIRKTHPGKTDMELTKTNSGERAFLEEATSYTLQKFRPDGTWHAIASFIPNRRGTIRVKNADEGCFYRLVKTAGNQLLERPFLWRNGEQEWW